MTTEKEGLAQGYDLSESSELRVEATGLAAGGIWRFHKIRCTTLGVPIPKGCIVFGGLFWETLIWGNYHTMHDRSHTWSIYFWLVPLGDTRILKRQPGRVLIMGRRTWTPKPLIIEFRVSDGYARPTSLM